MPPDASPRQIAAWVGGAVVLVVLGVLLLRGSSGSGSSPPAGAGAGAIAVQDTSGAGPGGRVLVDVAGAVHRPGVYRLRSGARVADAVARAGGARRRADLSAVNLAAKLEDGRQILVPVRTPAGAAAGPVSSGVPGAPPAPPVDLNTATLEQLDSLDGVGPVTAQKILAYRQQHGGFGSVDELGQIPGIGPKRLAALRDHVRV
jgi:competence protein ComEA